MVSEHSRCINSLRAIRGALVRGARAMTGKPSNSCFRKFWVGFAGLGFLVAALIWTYSEVSARSPHPANVQLWTFLIVLCPPSLLSIPFIDIEPGTSEFTVMWFVIGVINAAL